MDRFLSRFRSQIIGVLSGFDRLVFRGSLLPLIRDRGMYTFLKRAGIRLLDFKRFVTETSESIKEAAEAEAHREKRPLVYLDSSKTDKEELVQKLLAKHPIDKGLVCTLKTLEGCMSFEYHCSRDLGERGLRLRPKKCLHLYKYFIHPMFGFMGTRIQTWFPFNIQVWINGREWLAAHLRRAGIDFKRQDNCFTWLEDVDAAQRLMDKQMESDWPSVLSEVGRWLNPLHDQIFKPWPMDYYWSAYQCEWATDIMFKDPRSLGSLYPPLVRHAMFHLSSADVMRFLSPKAHGNYTGQMVTSFKDRAEGVRVKYWIDGNSLKMYDKAGSALRFETTTANMRGLPKVFRPPHYHPSGKSAWRQMRKGIADLHRRAQVSQRANERFIDALSTVDDSTPLSTILDEVSQPVIKKGRRSRAIRIGDANDVALLKAVAHGEFTVAGFRNRNIQRILHPVRRDASQQTTRKLSAKIGRQLRLLRAHGLIRKIPTTNRYLLTLKGNRLIAALFAARNATAKQLLRDAA